MWVEFDNFDSYKVFTDVGGGWFAREVEKERREGKMGRGREERGQRGRERLLGRRRRRRNILVEG